MLQRLGKALRDRIAQLEQTIADLNDAIAERDKIIKAHASELKNRDRIILEANAELGRYTKGNCVAITKQALKALNKRIEAWCKQTFNLTVDLGEKLDVGWLLFYCQYRQAQGLNNDAFADLLAQAKLQGFELVPIE